jgi:hypothetical protein
VAAGDPKAIGFLVVAAESPRRRPRMHLGRVDFVRMEFDKNYKEIYWAGTREKNKYYMVKWSYKRGFEDKRLEIVQYLLNV